MMYDEVAELGQQRCTSIYRRKAPPAGSAPRLQRKAISGFAVRFALITEGMSMKPVVFVIDGRTGAGKTEFTKAWLGKSGNALFNAGPERLGDPLSIGDAFAEHDMVGLDEISQFEPISAKSGIDRLIADAKASYKQLVLVVQEISQLAAIGIELPEETAYATFRAAPVTQAKFRFNGHELIVS